MVGQLLQGWLDYLSKLDWLIFLGHLCKCNVGLMMYTA